MIVYQVVARPNKSLEKVEWCGIGQFVAVMAAECGDRYFIAQ